MAYICCIFNRNLLFVWEITQMNFYVIFNYIEDFNIGVWGVVILHGVVYK